MRWLKGLFSGGSRYCAECRCTGWHLAECPVYRYGQQQYENWRKDLAARPATPQKGERDD